jgi:hypothetical protein
MQLSIEPHGRHSRRAQRARSALQSNPSFLDRLWIPGQAFGLPGMTIPAIRSTSFLSLEGRLLNVRLFVFLGDRV